VPRSPAARERATSAVSGLFSHLDQTQDVVSKWGQDYARTGSLSSLSLFFFIGRFKLKNNELRVIRE